MTTPTYTPIHSVSRTFPGERLIQRNQQLEHLKQLVAIKSLRIAWGAYEAAFTAVAASERRRIEAIRTAPAYAELLAELRDWLDDEVRLNPELVDAFDGHLEQLGAVLAFLHEQLPAFLETRPGQSFHVVSIA